jgi:hypothetical protein
MRLEINRNLWAGVLVVAFGGLFMLGARAYTIGTPAQMGSGFFPLMIGALMAALGLAIGARGLFARAADRAALHPVPLAMLVGALCLFGLLADDGGLVTAVVALVVVSARAGTEFRWLESILLAVGLAVFSVATFVYALGLPLRVWPAL